MILFGAGSSIPFNIPGMKGFTEEFLKRNKSNLLNAVRDAIDLSGETVGIDMSFDLESLLSVLSDLSGEAKEKPISLPTASFLLTHKTTKKEATKEYGKEALSTLQELRLFIFNTCMEPIKRGEREGSFGFLNRFYGPLMSVLNGTNLRSIQSFIRPVYSTNWDLCFKTWVDYINEPINDGTTISKQSQPVLDINRLGDTATGFAYVSLHGCLDLFRRTSPKGAGRYSTIQKMPDPIRYYEDKPELLKNVFMIYPLEAIGYEESVKSPYLDMLIKFRFTLMNEFMVFIIGYSLRDPTIGSILEEVIAERIRKGHLNLLSQDLDSRKEEASKNQFKIIVISPDPQELSENLKKQNLTNLLQTFVPINIRFPRLTDSDFKKKYTQVIERLIEELIAIHYLDTPHARDLKNVLKKECNMVITKVY